MTFVCENYIFAYQFCKLRYNKSSSRSEQSHPRQKALQYIKRVHEKREEEGIKRRLRTSIYHTIKVNQNRIIWLLIQIYQLFYFGFQIHQQDKTTIYIQISRPAKYICDMPRLSTYLIHWKFSSESSNNFVPLYQLRCACFKLFLYPFACLETI